VRGAFTFTLLRRPKPSELDFVFVVVIETGSCCIILAVPPFLDEEEELEVETNVCFTESVEAFLVLDEDGADCLLEESPPLLIVTSPVAS